MKQTHILEQFDVPQEADGWRFDQTVASLMPDFSRSRIQAWIKEGLVTLNGKAVRTRDTVHADDVINVDVTLEEQTQAQPEAMPLTIVHEDDDVIVINKPAGLVVHPGSGNATGTLVNALLHHDPQLAELPRAGLVHRLDKDTTGLLVIARNPGAHNYLVDILQERRISREYEAIAHGVIISGGVVDEPIGRHSTDRTRMSVQPSGKHAVTHYRVAGKYRFHTHLRVKLETGRTHQIRVHMAYLRHALVGDQTYAGRLALPAGMTDELRTTIRNFKRQALHARRLAFVHPAGHEVNFEVPPPADMQKLTAALRADLQAHES